MVESVEDLGPELQVAFLLAQRKALQHGAMSKAWVGGPMMMSRPAVP